MPANLEHTEFVMPRAVPTEGKSAPKAAAVLGITPAEVSRIEVDKKHGLSSTVFYNYVTGLGGSITIVTHDTRKRKIAIIHSPRQSQSQGRNTRDFPITKECADVGQFNEAARAILPSLRKSRNFPFESTGKILRVSPDSVRATERRSRQGIIITTLHRYATAYGGKITVLVRSGKTRKVAEFSSAERPVGKARANGNVALARLRA